MKYSHTSDHALLELALMKQELLLSPAVVGLGDVGQALEVAEVVSLWWWSCLWVSQWCWS